MPAASDPREVAVPHTWRPLGPLIMGTVLLIGLAVVCGASWISLGSEVQAEFTLFQLLTLAFLGLLIFACVYAIARSRVTATSTGLIVVNGYRKRTLEWAQIVAIRLPSGAPWARIDLVEGEEISAMGIQATDGLRARNAVRSLRALSERYGTPSR